MNEHKSRVPVYLLALFSVLLLLTAGALAQTQEQPEAAQAEGFAVSPALTDIPTDVIYQGLQTPGEGPEIEGGIRNPRLPWAVSDAASGTGSGAKTPSISGQADAALIEGSSTLSLPSPALTFDGVLQSDNASAGFGALTPPDTDGAVGPNHYVQQVNLLYKVFNKSGALVAGPFKLSSLWVAAGKADQCAAADAGDPIVLYDQIADRWILSQFAFASQTAAPYFECIAVSKTGDPTGGYYLYTFKTGGTTGANEFPDYPHIGVWPDGYYMMVHQFTLGGNFNGSGYYGFDRSKMLQGDPTASYIYFNMNLTNHPEGVGGSQPASVDGLRMPPAGAPNPFMYFTAAVWGDPKDGLRIFNFHADFTTPANSTLTEPYSTYQNPISVAAFDVTTPTGNQGRRAVPQPGLTVTAALDAITDRLMFRLQYRNFGTYESMVVTHTVGAPASTTFGTFRAAPRYYELRRPLNGSWAIQEQGTFAPADSLSRFMGSAAQDGAGNLAIGYTRSGAAAGQFPSLYYAGRVAGDPGNLSEALIFAGSGSQSSTGNRWGDYSALSVDPNDDCTFWYTNEYYSSTSSSNWRTRIGNFKFDGCTAPPRGTLTGKITSCTNGSPVPGALMQVSDGHSGTAGADGTYSIPLLAGGFTAFAKKNGFSTSSSTAITITDGNSTTLNACISGVPVLSVASTTVSGGDGSATLKPNDCKQLAVNVLNSGDAATGIAAQLTSSTPGINIAQPNSAYPDISNGATKANSSLFSITTSSALACGTPAQMTLTITTAQGVFTKNFTLATCSSAPIAFNGTVTSSSPLQTGRVFRTGTPSNCSSPNPTFPGLGDSNTHRYSLLGPFTNNSSVSTCVTVSMAPACTATNVFATAYSPSFNPSSIGTNYIGDGGSSTPTETFSVLVPAGQPMYLAVAGVGTGTATNAVCTQGFSGTLSGFANNSSGGVGACSVTPVAGTVQLIATAKLSKLANGSYRALVTIVNKGTGTAQNVVLSTATLGAASGSPVPVSIGSIAGNGGSAVLVETFAASAGASGSAVVQRLAGSYTGGTFTTSVKAILP